MDYERDPNKSGEPEADIGKGTSKFQGTEARVCATWLGRHRSSCGRSRVNEGQNRREQRQVQRPRVGEGPRVSFTGFKLLSVMESIGSFEQGQNTFICLKNKKNNMGKTE